ncbi:MAG TPA: hypothetical protein VFG92_08910 [Agromyces sp.]|nr:hypothetical protein [Agromyces sp.]
MTDALRPDEPVEGEYTDSELPRSAELLNGDDPLGAIPVVAGEGEYTDSELPPSAEFPNDGDDLVGTTPVVAVEGEYTDSELPLSAELPKEEYDEGDDLLGDTEEFDVEVIEIDDDDRI